MSNHGRFIWYELMTPNTDAAKTFYGAVFGWDIKDFGDGPNPYQMWTNNGQTFGAVQNSPAGGPPQAYWVGYVGVDDLDTTVAKAQSLGAQIHVPPTAIPNIGRICVLADPDGAVFAVFHTEQPQPISAPGTGDVSWRELMCSSPEASESFYQQLFGWAQSGSMDMDGSPYLMFKLPDGANSLGGYMVKPPPVPVHHWTYYITVDNIDEAMERVRTHGGTIVNGPMPIPGGKIANALDPHYGSFALYEETEEAEEPAAED